VDDDDKFVGQAFNTIENEDLMATNQFENMQEMANAPFGPKMNLSKEEYAKQLEELEEAERIHNDMTEPNKPQEPTPKRITITHEEVSMKKTQAFEGTGSGIKSSQSHKKFEHPPPPHKMVFHDFDYINP
jgi:hypothetical protein